MSGLSLRDFARALGGEIQGRQVVCPGPNHSRFDRSLSIRLSADAPGGFVVKSFAGDDFRDARDYVAAKLGLGPDAWKRDKTPSVDNIHERAQGQRTETLYNIQNKPDDAARIARARAIWDGALPATGSIVETYLQGRGLTLDLVYIVHDVIRYHPRCPWGDKVLGRTIFVPAMVAAMRQVDGDAITGVHRTRLTPEGAKVDRMMMGRASAAAVKLDSDDAVTIGLAIGEGIETCLAARQLGFRPTWALASAGAIAAFPVLGGIECLTLLAENDPTSDRAISECAARWHQAGREVTVVTPNFGSDLADAIGEVA